MLAETRTDTGKPIQRDTRSTVQRAANKSIRGATSRKTVQHSWSKCDGPEGVVPTRPSKTRQKMTKRKTRKRSNYVCEGINSTKAEQDESGTVGPSIEHRKNKLAKQCMTSKRNSQIKIRAFRPHAPAEVTESAPLGRFPLQYIRLCRNGG